MTEQIIELHHVRKSFGDHRVLNDISLTVPQGSVFAFLGNNGEGKSTTIRILTGLLTADSGTAKVLGKDILQHANEIKQQLGCLVEAPALYPQLTAREFLSIGCTLKKLPKTDITRVLSLVDMLDAKNQCIQQFSLGMKQRLALAHALLGSPKLLILDEPTNGLDPHGMLEIRNLIKNLPEQLGCSVFVSSHMLDEVEKVASHVALLQGGKIVCQSSLAELRAKQTSQLKLEVEHAQQAAQIIQQLGYASEFVNNHNLTVLGIKKEQIHQLNKQLVAADVKLFQAIFKQATLEEWFLQSTQYA